MIQQHIWRLENQESCSGATKMGNGTSPMGWVSSRPGTKLTSDWPMGTMLDIQERSKYQCRIAEDGVYCHAGLSPVVYEKDYTSLPIIVGYIQMLSKSIIKLPNSQESGS